MQVIVQYICFATNDPRHYVGKEWGAITNYNMEMPIEKVQEQTNHLFDKTAYKQTKAYLVIFITHKQYSDRV